jgi:hypothetical protein
MIPNRTGVPTTIRDKSGIADALPSPFGFGHIVYAVIASEAKQSTNRINGRPL